MRQLSVRLFLLFLAIGMLPSCLPINANADSLAAKREAVREMRGKTLAQLYRNHPAARADIRNSAGYAVFSDIGVNLVLLSAAGGSGVAHDNRTGRDIYMKMVSGGFGFGLGVKDFRGVFVFHTDKAFRHFVDNGWEASVQADVAAKSDDKGRAVASAIAVAPHVDLYQITENGLALQATIQGTKYYRDDALNRR